MFVSIPIGVLSAVRRNTLADRIAMSGALFAQVRPDVLVGDHAYSGIWSVDEVAAGIGAGDLCSFACCLP